MSIEKEKQPESKSGTVPSLQEQRNFLLLWRKLTPAQRNAVQKLIKTMLER